MTVIPWILMGGQYGSEGKGEVAADIATNPDNKISWSIRT